MKTLLAMALSVFTTAAWAADPFILVSDGQGKAQIVIGDGAPETVRFAAKELRVFVAKMSGAGLPIASRAAPGVPAIRLGPAAREVLPPDELQGIRRDGYVITVAKGDLCIVGMDDAGPRTDIEALLAKGETHSMPAWDFHRGTLYGVYRLLESLGMRWFMPGGFGERAPRSKTLTFSGEIRENPHFISRTVGYWSMWIGNNFRKDIKSLTIMPGEREAIGFTPAENRMWELRMRGATFQIPLNHYPPATRWAERFGREHPEYFALLPDSSRSNGSRHDDGHLCYSEPGVVRESVADVRAFAAGQPSETRGISRIHPITRQPMNVHNNGWPDHVAYGNHFSLLPHDGFRPCGCSRCAPLISSSGIQGEEHSRLVWDYIARCAVQVPDRNITCLAYGSYARPYPGMQKLPPNVVVGYCSLSHPASLYYKDGFAQYEAGIRGWAELAHGKLAFWQHYLASNRDEETVGMPEHTPEMHARAVRVMAKYGNHVFCEMMADSILFELFNRYLLMKLFYDPTLDEQEILRDYVRAFYGPDAGPLLGEIYADINAKCIERFRNRYAAYSIWEKLFGESTMREYQAKADRAVKLAAGTPYEPAAAAFKGYYLGLMERGRARYVDPLPHLLRSDNPELVRRLAKTKTMLSTLPVPRAKPVDDKAALEPTDVKSGQDRDRALAGFEAGLRAAGAMCQERKHEEAIRAYVKLGEGRSDPDERYQAISAAAVCARLHLGSEVRALDLCQRIRAQPHVKACRATVYQWATSPREVLKEFRDEDFSTWPESLAAIGYAVRASAHYNMENGPKAARDFLRSFQFAKSYAKWSALQRLGDTFWRLLDDEILAEACYRKCMSDFGGGWPGLQARVNLGELLVSQKRYDLALQCLSGAPGAGGYWKAAMLMGTAKVHIAAGRKSEATAALKQALATAGLYPSQKTECEALLSTLK
jgi:hypothetical protein